MASEVDGLREKLELLERRIDNERHMRGSVETEVSATTIMVEEFVIPAILLLAGHGFRPQLREMLAMTEVSMGALEPLPQLETSLEQLRRWRRVVDALPPWPGTSPSRLD